MANEQNDIVIAVDEDENKDKPAASGAVSDAAPVIEPEEGLETLKQRLASERAARVEAERRAQSAEQVVVATKNEAQDANLHLVTNAIETVKQNSAVLKRNYAEAMAASDFVAAAEAQEQMAANSAKLLQLEQGRIALENAPKQQVMQPVRPADPVEALAAQLSPRSAAWVRANPQFARDSRLYAKMIAAHNLAVADGISPDTDEYFETVESTLKMTRNAAPASDDPMSAAAQPVSRRTPPPAAPVSRSGSTPGSRPNVVRLTSAEREMAQMMGMTEQEYAKNKLALQREGKLN
jgi:hypothetical protein